jgi:DNA-binding response OmpR family regulator
MAPRILVIEDDDSLLELYQQLLQEEGYEVSLSSTTFEDVTEVERLHPDLVLLDVKISGPDDGFTLLERLRSYLPTHCLPIMLCTAATASQVRKRVADLQQQGVPVVYKPFEIEELCHTIRLALRSAEAAGVA